MNRLVLDHFRRWSLVLAVVSLAEFALGWLIALGPQYTYEFWAFALSLWAGPTLLSFDLKRGMLRPVAILPLAGKQMGRSWWRATVPVPAIMLAVLLFLGAGTCCHLLPRHTFPVQRLALASVFTTVWLGMQFPLTFSTARGFGRNNREFIGRSFASMFAGLAFFASMVLCNGASKSPLRASLLLAIGAVLTAVGWVWAEQFDPGLAGLYLGRIEPPKLQRGPMQLTPLEPRKLASLYQVPNAFGGIRFLLRTVCVWAFVQIAAIVGLMALLWAWLGRTVSQPLDFQMVATMSTFMPCWFVVFYQFQPLLRHLRFLRTLPISATGIASVLLTVALLPPVALGSLLSLVAWLVSGPPAALLFVKIYAFALGGVALCVFLAVWRGSGTQGYALLLFTLFGCLLGYLWFQARFNYQEWSLALAAAIGIGGVLLAFVLTRQTLIHSGCAYRVQAPAFGSFPMRASG